MRIKCDLPMAIAVRDILVLRKWTWKLWCPNTCLRLKFTAIYFHLSVCFARLKISHESLCKFVKRNLFCSPSVIDGFLLVLHGRQRYTGLPAFLWLDSRWHKGQRVSLIAHGLIVRCFRLQTARPFAPVWLRMAIMSLERWSRLKIRQCWFATRVYVHEADAHLTCTALTTINIQ